MTELSQNDQRCRACLNENVSLVYLYEQYEHSQTLANILQMCLNKEVSQTFKVWLISLRNVYSLSGKRKRWFTSLPMRSVCHSCNRFSQFYCSI